MQAIMTIILNSLHIASSFREKLRMFFEFFTLLQKERSSRQNDLGIYQKLEKKGKGITIK